MVVVLLFINKFLPFDLYTRKGSLVVVIINTLLGAGVYLGLSYKLGLIDSIFGREYLNKVIKKLTFGKFPKNKD